MKEVSCSVTAPLIREFRKQGLPAADLAVGSGYSLAYLENKHERIEWRAFLRIIANARGHWNDEHFKEYGASFLKSPIIRSFTIVARLLFTVREFYLWIANSAPVFTCIRGGPIRELGPNRMEISALLADGYEPCREFYLITLGGFAELPRLF
ncbi:MAG TPA: hypothetical protein VHB97_26105, partial [Polyangia bacterium]|nr:hypothetical protein [Polyangia bacterium]